MTKKNFRILVGVVFVVIFCVFLGRYLFSMPKRHYGDFRVYHHAAQVFLEHGDIYERDQESVTPFKYSPFFAFAVSPIGFLSIRVAAVTFFSLNFIAAIILFCFSRKLFLIGKSQIIGRLSWLMYGLVFLFVLRSLSLAIQSGQVGILVAAIAVLGLYFFETRRPILGGMCLAATILVKYMPFLFVPYFIIRRKFLAANFVLLFAGAWLLLPMVYAGFPQWMDEMSKWIPSIVSTSLDHGSYYDYKNQSLYSMVLRFVTDSEFGINFLHLSFEQGMKIAYGIGAVLYLVVLIPGRQPDGWQVDYSLIFILIAILNPNAWLHNFVVLVAPYTLAMLYVFDGKSKKVRWGIAVAVALSFILSVITDRGVAGRGISSFALSWSFGVLSALILFAALLREKFRKPAIKMSIN